MHIPVIHYSIMITRNATWWWLTTILSTITHIRAVNFFQGWQGCWKPEPTAPQTLQGLWSFRAAPSSSTQSILSPFCNLSKQAQEPYVHGAYGMVKDGQWMEMSKTTMNTIIVGKSGHTPNWTCPKWFVETCCLGDTKWFAFFFAANIGLKIRTMYHYLTEPA